MKVMVLGGAGAVASETTKDLVYNSKFDEIVIADINLEKAQILANELTNNCKNRFIPEEYRCLANTKEFEQKKITAIKVDILNMAEAVKILKGVDVIACGLPGKLLEPAVKAIVNAGVNGMDLSGEAAILNYFNEDLHSIAVKNDCVFVSGVGATPGITNIMARKAFLQLDKTEEVRINFAAFRSLAPSAGLLRTTFWEFDPATKERVYFMNGEFIRVEPFSGAKRVKFHEQIGEQEVVYIPHSEVATISQNFPEIKYVSVHGTFPPHVMQIMKACLEAGVMSHEEIIFYNRTTTPIQVMEDLLARLPETKQNPIWAYGLVVEVKGQKNGETKVLRFYNEHPAQEVWGGDSAYYKNVGIPLAVGAEIMAYLEPRPEIKGIFAPEMYFEPNLFFERLSLRGIKIKEEIL
jgi:saccharopine dehydrogenase-like NADP-dependent oxidoreductase